MKISVLQETVTGLLTLIIKFRGSEQKYVTSHGFSLPSLFQNKQFWEELLSRGGPCAGWVSTSIIAGEGQQKIY
jgi:hypothetical protein